MFSKATKKHAKLRLALCGPSGSGKTMSALRLAKGMGGRIALIDTERRSASLYADKFEFDVVEIEPPYKPSRYIEAIEAAAQAGYSVLVIDSLSHAWAGEGGIIETVDDSQAKGENKFTAWGAAGKAQNKLINTILGAPIHIIATLRAKMEYVLETNAKGKQVPRKVGLAPVQRDGVEYEFGTVIDIAMSHEAHVGLAGKDRTGLFVDKPPRMLSEKDGADLIAWLNTGEDEPPKAEAPPPPQKPRKITATDEAHAKAMRNATTRTGLRDYWDLIPSDQQKKLVAVRDECKLKLLKSEIDAVVTEHQFGMQFEIMLDNMGVRWDQLKADEAERVLQALQTQFKEKVPA